MYRGRIVEMGGARSVYESPRHPYTKTLLASRPAALAAGAVAAVPAAPVEAAASAAAPARGCPFAERCPAVMPVCREVEPGPTPVAGGFVRCHLHGPGAPAEPGKH